VRRLRPDWRDPEEFYELRSEVSSGLNRLAHRLGRLPSPPLPVIPRPPPPPPAPVTPPSVLMGAGWAGLCRTFWLWTAPPEVACQIVILTKECS
jgi:hypothetical protein